MKVIYFWLFCLLPAACVGGPYDSIEEYDVVSFFQIEPSNNPKKGDRRFTYQWNKKVWYFSSDKNMRLFAAHPSKYAPAYDGLCAYAIGHNYRYSADPLAWTIKDGRLFLNYSKEVRNDWLQKVDDYIRQGDLNWVHLKN